MRVAVLLTFLVFSAIALAKPATATTLFVEDVGAKAIFRYQYQGVTPPATPTSTLNLPGPPQAFAAGPDGSLYVSIAGSKGLNIYGPQATGHAAPAQVIPLGYVPQAIAIGIYIYLAHPLDFVETYFSNGTPAGDVRLHQGRQRIVSIALDQLGRLFVSATTRFRPILVEFSQPGAVSGQPVVESELFAISPNAMAFDQSDELYIADGDAAAISPAASDVYPPDRYLARQSPTFFARGIAILGRNAFVSSYGTGIAPAVFGFDDLHADAKPLFTLSGGGLVEPAALAVLP